MDRRSFLVMPLAAHAAGQDVQDPFKISVHVDLVVLHATVRDRKGAVPAGLRQSDFQVYEDGVRQDIRLFRHEDLTITAGLVVDHSGSMGPKIKEVAAAVRTFARSSNANDQIFVVNFNELVTLGLPASKPFTNSAGVLEFAILRQQVTGKTALYDAVMRGFEGLRTGEREKKVLIVISDGGDNASKATLQQVLQTAGEASALVYTIGIWDADDPDKNPGVLRSLARVTGGEAYFPEELPEIVRICERIAFDIRNQYTLGYLSSQHGKPGERRSIRVSANTAETGKLLVRARTGYIVRPAR